MQVKNCVVKLCDGHFDESPLIFSRSDMRINLDTFTFTVALTFEEFDRFWHSTSYNLHCVITNDDNSFFIVLVNMRGQLIGEYYHNPNEENIDVKFTPHEDMDIGAYGYMGSSENLLNSSSKK